MNLCNHKGNQIRRVNNPSITETYQASRFFLILSGSDKRCQNRFSVSRQAYCELFKPTMPTIMAGHSVRTYRQSSITVQIRWAISISLMKALNNCFFFIFFYFLHFLYLSLKILLRFKVFVCP